ncbi:hypothetical protein BYT27DRAFT_6549681 [Phlegmacium glaucopus]|nr:hypothetical protein BYT27DRAFT_6549681 [Phlegmacium glaucopus]
MHNIISSDSDRGTPGQKKVSRVARKIGRKGSRADFGFPSDSDPDCSGAKTASDDSGYIALTRDTKKGEKCRYVLWGQGQRAGEKERRSQSASLKRRRVRTTTL